MTGMNIGPYTLSAPVLVAPMAGVTDRPFRMLVKKLGAPYAVCEMAASNPKLWDSVKTSRRLNHDGESAPIAVQIAGSDPFMMAEAAKFNVDKGAHIIDINMGCPVKKVCHVACGSALLQNELLVAQILNAVVKSVDVPVTLKYRTGWDRAHKNALTIAKIAQDAGIQALVLHGRTRADLYLGQAEYETIAQVKAQVTIPVIANGDINSPEKAKWVLEQTKADAVMIGRAGQGKPWIYAQVAYFLKTGQHLAAPSSDRIKHILLEHLTDHYDFYGEYQGVRTARKHIQWYTQDAPGFDVFWDRLCTIENTQLQQTQLVDYLDQLQESGYVWS